MKILFYTNLAIVLTASTVLAEFSGNAWFQESAKIERAKFQSPEAVSKPWVIYYWIDGNVSADGITKDLEAMKAQGFAGVLWGEVGQFYPQGSASDVSSDARNNLVDHFFREAGRLDLVIGFFNSPGWSGSSGPHIPASMMPSMAGSTVTMVNGGGASGSVQLNRHQRNVRATLAVQAVPVKAYAEITTDLNLKLGAFVAGSIKNPITPSDGIAIDPAEMIDLTEKVSPDGVLEQDALPSGEWLVFWTAQHDLPMPIRCGPAGNRGYQLDKFKKEAVDRHFDAWVDPMVKRGRARGATISICHFDSWEFGAQNWSDDMFESFQSYTGYDLKPYMPVFAGTPVGSVEESEKVLWDFRRVLCWMLEERYIKPGKERANALGLEYSWQQAWGHAQIFDQIDSFGLVDMQSGNHTVPLAQNASLNSPVQEKRPIRYIGYEGLTCGPNSAKFTQSPIDYQYTLFSHMFWGYNFTYFHVFNSQRFEVPGPGVTLSRWGTHFGRKNTFWNRLSDWTEMVSRASYMGRRMTPISRIVHLADQGLPNTHLYGDLDSLYPSLPKGYQGDFCSSSQFLNAGVMGNDLVLSGNRRYDVLILPNRRYISAEVLRKVREIQDKGVLVIGAADAPFYGSPTMVGGAAENDRAKKIWEECKESGLLPYAKMAPALAKRLNGPCSQANVDVAIKRLRYGHELGFYLFNPHRQIVSFTGSFRDAEGIPVLFDPASGEVNPLPCRMEEHRAEIPMVLLPGQAVYVLFRKTDDATPLADTEYDELCRWILDTSLSSGDRKQIACLGGIKAAEVLKAASAEGAMTMDLSGMGWSAYFVPATGYDRPFNRAIGRLIDFKDHSDPAVRGFSGDVVYSRAFELKQRPSGKVYIDLGMVEDLAALEVNGEMLTTLYGKPFVWEVSGQLKPGSNNLKVHVTTTWANRLIADAKLPEDLDHRKDIEEKSPTFWPEWLMAGKAAPSGRKAFITYPYWKENDSFLSSGMIGPVVLSSGVGKNTLASKK